MGMNEQELLVPADVAEQYQQEVENLTREVDQLMVVKDEVLDEEIARAGGGSGGYKIEEETFRPRNRAERRALDKATRRQKQKKRRMFADSIKETAEKLAYINMIQKVRELNEQIKAEGEKENEAAN